jgi:anti-sigma regulatory factor (Ser/Thr protein kinase)
MSMPLSTPADERRVFAARLEALPETAIFVDAFCARNGLGTEIALRLTLVVEELFTNSVMHGYGGECDAPIEIALATLGDKIALCYEDAAPAYDPLSRFAAPDHLLGTVESRPAGGLGIHLVRELIANSRYAREAGRNRLWLWIVCER